jgi:hypothetical protein
VPKLSVHGTVSRSTGRLPLTRAVWVLAAVVAVASFARLGLDAVDAAAHNRVYLGAATAAAQDSMQYLTWATDAVELRYPARGLEATPCGHPAKLCAVATEFSGTIRKAAACRFT